MENKERDYTSRKRRGTQSQDEYQFMKLIRPDEDDNDDFLTLSLTFRHSRSSTQASIDQQQRNTTSPPPPPPSPPPLMLQPSPSMAQTQSYFPQSSSPPDRELPLPLSPARSLYIATLVAETSATTSSNRPLVYRQETVGPSRPVRARRNPTQCPREGKSEQVPAPFPWATTQRATVHSLNYLVNQQMVTITGEVQCKRCERHYEIEYDLQKKFVEVWDFVAKNKSSMHDRAPSVWMNPALPTCMYCEQENSAKPVIAEKKKAINWLFLLLGQMLGCCTLEQLKYFCKHTKNHRTGAKDRVLYLTYLGLCKQLEPNGPFDR